MKQNSTAAEGPLFGMQMLENPFPVYHEMRRREPVQWNEDVNAWIVTRYEDIRAVMKDVRYSSDRVTTARSRYDGRFQPVFDLLSRLMLQVDDPRHKRLRNLVISAFTRTAVERYEAVIRRLCDELLEPALRDGEMEFVSEFAAKLPIMVISEIVGMPPEMRPSVKMWSDAFAVVALNFYSHVTDEQLQHCSDCMDAFAEYMNSRVEACRHNPADDLLSSLVVAADNDASLDMDELIANAILLLAAGNETTSCLLVNGLALLLRHPDQMALLRNEPERIPDAIEEFLRVESPVQFLGRLATDDLELAGHKIGKGQMVFPVLAAGNRDPDVFERPDELDITRNHINQLGFGTGQHLCAGIQLARFEARVAFETLLRKFPSIRMIGDTPQHRPVFNLRCYRELRIAVA